jgi:hypothetical protein
VGVGLIVKADSGILTGKTETFGAVMTFHRTTVAVLALIAAAPVLAQDGPLTADGDMGLYYAYSDGGSETFITGDVDLAYSFGAFGVDLSLIGYADNDDSASGIFGGGSFTFGNGAKIVLGAPRSVYDRFGRPGFVRASKVSAFNPYFGGMSLLTFSEIDGDTDDIGVSFAMGSQSGTQFAGSYHTSDDNNWDVYALGGSFSTGTFRIEGAAEFVDTAGTNTSLIKVSGHTQLGQIDAGAYLQHTREGSVSLTFAEVNADYELTDKINVGGSLGYVFEPGDDASVISAFGSYEVFDGMKGSLGAFKRQGSEAQYQLGLGLEF